MLKYINKNTVFSALLALILVLIAVRITPVHVDQVVKVVITKNATSIGNIHQERNISTTKEVMVDRLNLLDKSRFSHPKLGNIANVTDDFFVDVDHSIKITKADNYRFMIGSDDGFSLSIDNKLLCEHQTDRPYSVQACMIFLTEGTHQFHLSYFQGFGNSGLTVEYARGDEKQHWFGDDSDSVEF
jgi:hypothetical protein